MEMEKEIIEKYMISKDDMEKYFGNRKVISREEYIQYIFKNKKLM